MFSIAGYGNKLYFSGYEIGCNSYYRAWNRVERPIGPILQPLRNLLLPGMETGSFVSKSVAVWCMSKLKTVILDYPPLDAETNVGRCPHPHWIRPSSYLGLDKAGSIWTPWTNVWWTWPMTLCCSLIRIFVKDDLGAFPSGCKRSYPMATYIVLAGKIVCMGVKKGTKLAAWLWVEHCHPILMSFPFVVWQNNWLGWIVLVIADWIW